MAKRCPWCGDKGDINFDGVITNSDCGPIYNHTNAVSYITDPATIKRCYLMCNGTVSGDDDTLTRKIVEQEASDILLYVTAHDVGKSTAQRMMLSAYTGLQKEGYNPIYYNPTDSSLSITTSSEKTLLTQTSDWDEIT